MASDRRLGWGLAALGMLLVSTDSVFVRASETSSWNIAFLVAILAIPVQAVLHHFFGRPVSVASLKADWKPLIAVAALAAVTQLAFIVALTKTDIANVVVIVAASPLLAALVAWLALREAPTRVVAIAIAITMVGIGIVVSGSIGGPNLEGDLIAVLAIASFAASLVVWRRYPDLNRFVALGLSGLLMALMAAPFTTLGDLDARAYWAAAGMGLVFNPLGRIAHSNAPRFAPTAEVALFTPVETVAGTVWALIFFSEVPAVATVFGGVIVIAGVLFGTVASSRSPPQL